MGIINMQNTKFICNQCGKEFDMLKDVQVDVGSDAIRINGRPPAGWITLLGIRATAVVCSTKCLKEYADECE